MLTNLVQVGRRLRVRSARDLCGVTACPNGSAEVCGELEIWESHRAIAVFSAQLALVGDVACSRCHFSAAYGGGRSTRSIGNAMTSARLLAPAASMTVRSNPRATPVQSGRPWRHGLQQPALSWQPRLALGGPRRWRFDFGPPARPGRAVHGSRWPTQCRERTTQTARPSAICRGHGPAAWLAG